MRREVSRALKQKTRPSEPRILPLQPRQGQDLLAGIPTPEQWRKLPPDERREWYARSLEQIKALEEEKQRLEEHRGEYSQDERPLCPDCGLPICPDCGRNDCDGAWSE